MKKSLLIIAVAIGMFSCNKEGGTTTTGTRFKTAYVNTSTLSKDYEAFKELDSQRKIKEEEMGRELDTKVQAYKLDRAAAENEAPAKGPQWVQLKAQEFQKREREIAVMQESMMKQLQEEFGTKNDSAVSKMKKFIRDYGKKNGYDYIYGSGEVTNTVLYAKDGYDITDEILKALNAEFKPAAKTEPAKAEGKK